MNARMLQLLSLHRYPGFFTDLVAAKVLLLYLRAFHDFLIGESAVVRGLPIISIARHSSVRIGDRAYLISRSRNTALGVNHPIILRTVKSGARIGIGHRFRASGVTLCSANGIAIGDRVTLGANVTVADTDFHASDAQVRSSPEDASEAKNARIAIGDDVFVGMNALILKGVTIGPGAVIGAGAVVTRDVPDGAVAAGNPARIISPTKEAHL
jgi:acetyltransferase-like isoleucine patch superfamily enzyme